MTDSSKFHRSPVFGGTGQTPERAGPLLVGPGPALPGTCKALESAQPTTDGEVEVYG